MVGLRGGGGLGGRVPEGGEGRGGLGGGRGWGGGVEVWWGSRW